MNRFACYPSLLCVCTIRNKRWNQNWFRKYKNRSLPILVSLRFFITQVLPRALIASLSLGHTLLSIYSFCLFISPSLFLALRFVNFVSFLFQSASSGSSSKSRLQKSRTSKSRHKKSRSVNISNVQKSRKVKISNGKNPRSAHCARCSPLARLSGCRAFLLSSFP